MCLTEFMFFFWKMSRYFRAEKRHKGNGKPFFKRVLMLITLVCGAFSLFNAVALVICGCSLPQELVSVHISILQDKNLCLSLLGQSVLTCCQLFHPEIGPFYVHGLSRRSPDVPDCSVPDYFQSALMQYLISSSSSSRYSR